MAFESTLMAKTTTNATEGLVNIGFAYGPSAADDKSVIKAVGYFNTFADQMTVGDYIYIEGDDLGNEIVVVTAITPDVTVTVLATQNQSAVARFSGTFTTVGGASTEVFVVTGALPTDLAFVMLDAQGGAPVTIETAKAGTNDFSVKFTGDPLNDHVISFILMRAL